MKINRKTLLLTSAWLAVAMAPTPAFAWGNVTGGDHLGADWAPGHGALIAGTHTNIRNFTVPAGAMVYVHPFDGGASYGNLVIYAENIVVAGVLNAAGSGWGGGGGGGGGTGGNGPYQHCAREDLTTGQHSLGGAGTRGGASGTNGYKDYPMTGVTLISGASPGRSVGGAGGAGGGPCAGAGGGITRSVDSDGARTGAAGGNATRCQNDANTTETLYMGSGGGGGGGGAHSYEPMHGSIGGSGGGGAGGSGGGTIKLYANSNITISGHVFASGRDGGGVGGAGNDGSGGVYTAYGCDLQGIGGNGATADWFQTAGTAGTGVAGYYNKNANNACISRLCYYSSGAAAPLSAAFDKSYTGANGGAGGRGAGGSVLLNARTLNLQAGSLIDVLGGGSSGANGGALKIFYCNYPTFNGALNVDGASKFFLVQKTDCLMDIGLRVWDGTKQIAVAVEAENGNVPNLKVYDNDAKYGAGKYSVLLINTNNPAIDPDATRIGIRTNAGMKYLRSCNSSVALVGNQILTKCNSKK